MQPNGVNGANASNVVNREYSSDGELGEAANETQVLIFKVF